MGHPVHFQRMFCYLEVTCVKNEKKKGSISVVFRMIEILNFLSFRNKGTEGYFKVCIKIVCSLFLITDCECLEFELPDYWIHRCNLHEHGNRLHFFCPVKVGERKL